MKNNPLQFALEFERLGAQMYLELAAQTDNPLGKKLFYSLATEEVDHARQIDVLSAQLKDQSGMGVLDTLTLPPVNEVIKTFFTTVEKTSLKGNVSNIAAYDINYAYQLGYTDQQIMSTASGANAGAFRQGPVGSGADYNQNYAPVSPSYTGQQWYWDGLHSRKKAGGIPAQGF